jgi:glycosyltransferase involved in cell wall biosynthesis
MKISLIMPVFNGAETIGRAISSYKELLKFNDIDPTLYIIDNKSNDDTSEVIKDFASPSSRIHIIENEANIGPGLARNIALDKVKEGFVGFLDADDEIIPENYYTTLKEGLSKGADWITFNAWNEKKNVFRERYDWHRIKNDTNILISNCLRSDLDGSVIFSIYSVDLIKRLHLRFHSDFFEDIPFAHTAMLAAKFRYISNRISYIRHSTVGSITTTISKKHITGLIKSCVMVKEEIQKLNVPKNSNLEADFIFGAYGYLSNLIRAILEDIKSTDETKIELLEHLIKTKKGISELSELPVKKGTKKELLASYFIEQYETSNTKSQFTGKDILHSLINKCKEIFG